MHARCTPVLRAKKTRRVSGGLSCDMKTKSDWQLDESFWNLGRKLYRVGVIAFNAV